jgi:hypothetical protein
LEEEGELSGESTGDHAQESLPESRGSLSEDPLRAARSLAAGGVGLSTELLPNTFDKWYAEGLNNGKASSFKEGLKEGKQASQK